MMKPHEYMMMIGSALMTMPGLLASAPDQADSRPNILVVISDDQSWPDAGAYGNRFVRTPAFDRIAAEGVLFSRAYCASPSCTPSRAAVLTGQDVWRLGEGANLFGTLPSNYAVYPDLLEGAGYRVGYTGKAWSPGNEAAGGRERNPAGDPYGSFGKFLESVPESTPFCFWFGSGKPHRPYSKGSGLASGKKLEDVTVPDFLPDVPEVRSDILDYYLAIEQFDRQLAGLIGALEEKRLLDNTLIIVTSDNGMPFPRGKTTLYDAGVRMPLAIRWANRVPAGRKVDDFVNLTDLAPTIMEAAGLAVHPDMTGRSLMPLLISKESGRIDPTRDHVVVARERHGWNRQPNVGYPMRAIHTNDHVYIVNFAQDRRPGFDTDKGPSLDYLLENRERQSVRRFFELFFEPRPAEELYSNSEDPFQLHNIASDPKYAETKKALRNQLEDYLTRTGDPRMSGEGGKFDTYKYYGRPTGNWTMLEDIPAKRH